MRLAELQDRIQAAILRGDIAAFPPCRETANFDGETRFAVYSDAYRLRLASFISHDYPVLREAMGDERFGALVEAFVANVPSHVPTAQAYTRQLSDFAESTSPWCEHRPMVDLARFECALGRAFDSADAPAFGIETLAEFLEDDWPRLVVSFHPSAATLLLLEGVVPTYERLSSEVASSAEPPRFHMPTSERMEHVLIWRTEHGVVYRGMEPIEREAFDSAKSGRTFAEICTSIAGSDRDEESVMHAAATVLSRWFADGIIAAVGVGST